MDYGPDTASDPIYRPQDSSGSEADAASPRKHSADHHTQGSKRARVSSDMQSSKSHEMTLVVGTTVFWRVDDSSSLLTFNALYNQPVFYQFDEATSTAVPITAELGKPEHGALQLQGFFKELDENTMVPATMDDFKAYFGGIAMHSAGKTLPPRVLVSIECGKAKGLVTYKQDAPQGTVLYEECGVLKECTPTQFELHKAGSNHRSWRKSFRVAGCLKVAKASKPAAQLAPASISDMQRYLESILGIKRKKVTPNTAPSAAAHPTAAAKDTRMVAAAPAYSGLYSAPSLQTGGGAVDVFGAVPVSGRVLPTVPGVPPPQYVQPYVGQRRDPRAAPQTIDMVSPAFEAPSMPPPRESYVGIPLVGQADARREGHNMSKGEAEAIKLIMSSTSGPDVAHAVQGILYHALKFHNERYIAASARTDHASGVDISRSEGATPAAEHAADGPSPAAFGSGPSSSHERKPPADHRPHCIQPVFGNERSLGVPDFNGGGGTAVHEGAAAISFGTNARDRDGQGDGIPETAGMRSGPSLNAKVDDVTRGVPPADADSAGPAGAGGTTSPAADVAAQVAGGTEARAVMSGIQAQELQAHSKGHDDDGSPPASGVALVTARADAPGAHVAVDTTVVPPAVCSAPSASDAGVDTEMAEAFLSEDSAAGLAQATLMVPARVKSEVVDVFDVGRTAASGQGCEEPSLLVPPVAAPIVLQL